MPEAEAEDAPEDEGSGEEESDDGESTCEDGEMSEEGEEGEERVRWFVISKQSHHTLLLIYVCSHIAHGTVWLGLRRSATRRASWRI